jgi:cardiolipin synthetase 2 (EC 2.7.8.-)
LRVNANGLHLLFGALYVLAAAASSLHALLHKRDPRAAMGWIGLCWLMPYGGAVLYALFGINRVASRAQRLRGAAAIPRAGEGAAAAREDPLAQLRRIGEAVTGLPLLEGAQVDPLADAEVAFPAMLEAIEGARRVVWLSSYLFSAGGWCRRFVDALAAAAARGVEVRVLVDGFGEFYSLPRAVGRLTAAGVTAARFLPPRLLPPTLFINLRNHRKLLVVDRELAFAGGMNISNRHLLRGRRRVSDLHFRLRGPVVAQIAEVFAEDWRFATGETLALTPPPPAVGSAACRVISDGPDDDLDRLVLVMVAAVAAAHRRICIRTPYFLPPRELAVALQAAAVRGVEVDILLPARSNLPFVDWAGRHGLSELVERGVRVWLMPPPFAHHKLLLVDGDYALIGSANLDPRSLRLNFEVCVEVFDAALCERLCADFYRAREQARALDGHNLAARRLPVRIRDGLCWLFSPYL